MSKEIPILFNGDMVRAILAGDKSQTRRPIKNMPRGFEPRGNPPETGCITSSHPQKGKHGVFIKQDAPIGQVVDLLPSPFGKAGDVLWVRETFRVDAYGPYADAYGAYLDYASDNARVFIETDKSLENKLDKLYRKSTSASGGVSTFIPSIHMPKVACRIKLKVKRVWVERVQDIDELGAKAEGFVCRSWKSDKHNKCWDADKYASSVFSGCWDSIYRTWNDNPWVWACEFEVIEK